MAGYFFHIGDVNERFFASSPSLEVEKNVESCDCDGTETTHCPLDLKQFQKSGEVEI